MLLPCDFLNTNISDAIVTAMRSSSATRSADASRAPRYVARSRFNSTSRSSVIVALITDRSASSNRGRSVACNALALYALAQLDQVIRCRHRNQHDAVGGQHAIGLPGIATSVQRHEQIDARVEQRQAAIGIRHHPGVTREPAGGTIGGSRRQIDADAARLEPFAQRGERITGSRSEIDDHRCGAERKRNCLRTHAIDQCPTHSRRQQRRARRDRLTRIAGIERSPVLRLQQVDIAAARDVVGMAGSTRELCLASLERQSTPTNSARQRTVRHLERCHGASSRIEACLTLVGIDRDVSCMANGRRAARALPNHR
jgi:hypothetical protein